MKKLGIIILPIIAIILEVLPLGAVLIFAPSPTERIRETYSYFSLTPFGYANFAPFITALLTCLLLILAIVVMLCKKDAIKKALFGVSLLTVIVSIVPLVFGIEYYTIISGVISATLLLECIICRKNI